MLIRIVDIGSNSVKASLYAVERGAHRLVARNKLDYSPGNAVFPRGRIPDSGLAKIAAFVRDAGGRSGARPHFTFVLATSAVRSAQNRDTFVKRLAAETGVEVRVLSGAEESFLIHTGILAGAGGKLKGVTKTIDIGGGSAEVSWSRDGRYLFGRSYELGAIRLARAFADGKPYTREGLQRIHDFALEQFRARSPAAAPPADRAIGSSGNVRAIGRMLRRVRSRVFSARVPEVTPGALEDIAEISAGLTPAGVASFFDLPPDRARIILPAVMVLLASLRHFGIARLGIVEAGLREGAAAYWSRHGHLNLPELEEHEPQAQVADAKSRPKVRKARKPR